MNPNNLTQFQTGILVPLFTLRTSDSPGCGDFLSLIEFGQWCVAAGIDIIQLLPVNDSGTDPSPYSALSAYALHPLFIRLSDMPEYTMADEANTQRLFDCEKKDRLSYHEVLGMKMSILKSLFEAHFTDIIASKDFLTWVDKNTWVREYAVFRSIKEENESRSWLEWPEHRHPSEHEIECLWNEKAYLRLNIFYAWLQYRLEEQFTRAAQALRKMGIVLKGDIPILMNDDSVAVWAHPDMFHFDLRAGAPPDMFSTLGQNWGFPIYNWEYLEQQNYSWWRLRLQQAAKFYDAYRIDHVLGFFRIWAIPYSHKEGALGYFTPAQYIQRSELHEIGLDDGRIHWLSTAHLHYTQLQDLFASHLEEVISCCFRKLDAEELYVFKDDICGEKDILSMHLSESIKELILHIYRDRVFMQIGENEFAETWTFRSCSRYMHLSDGEKRGLEQLILHKTQEGEKIWQARGKTLLSFMREETDMLCCAEDLGVVPLCVPGVLSELGILGLKIPRWEHSDSHSDGHFTPPVQYPYQSVCAFSVHDTSTLRAWWEYEGHSEEFWQCIDLDTPFSKEYTPETAWQLIGGLLKTNSAIAVLQIQDLFALDNAYRKPDSREERMNIPGTVQDRNWSYRMPMLVSDLMRNRNFTEKIHTLMSKRKQQSTKK